MNKVRGLLARPEVAVVAAMGLQAVAAMLFAVLTARWLGPDDRGIVVLAATAGTLLMLVGSAGTATGARVLIARTGRRHLPAGDAIITTRPLVYAHFATSLVAGAIIFAASGGLRGGAVLVWFVPYAVLLLATYQRRELLHGVGRHRTAVLGDIVSALVPTVLVCILKAFDQVSWWSAMLSLDIGLLAQLLLLRAAMPDARTGRRRSLAALATFSVPAMITALGQSFALRGDRLILGMLAGTGAAGIYGSAASLSETVTLLAAGVGQVIFRSAAVGQARLGGRLRTGVLATTTVGAALLAALGSFIIGLLLGPAYSGAVPLLWVLCAATIPLASYQMDVAAMNGLGRLREARNATVAGAVALAVGCLALIPFIGAIGAAVASCVCYSVMAVVVRRDLRKALS